MLTWNEQKRKEFFENGYVYLGNILEDEIFKRIENKIDQIMLGKASIDYDKLLMQLDSDDGVYENAGDQSNGFKGATLNYRKIQNLEIDSDFMEYLTDPIFQKINADIYGEETPIAIFRAMFMNKPAGKGTKLPMHQDRWNYLSKDPLLTIYTGIDAATEENGCVILIEKSQHKGIVNPSNMSGFLTPEQAEIHCKTNIKKIILKQGDVVALHNQAIHGSDINRSKNSRRAFSVCYMDATTTKTNLKNREEYTPVFQNSNRRKAGLVEAASGCLQTAQ